MTASLSVAWKKSALSAGGIVIPDSATEKPIQGEDHRRRSRARSSRTASVRALDVKVGDRVLFGKYSGTEVKIDGKEFLVMREEDIMACRRGLIVLPSL
jgi:chaperonin GroES